MKKMKNYLSILYRPIVKKKRGKILSSCEVMLSDILLDLWIDCEF